MKKGQMFIMAALIFSSLLILVGFSFESIIQGGDDPKIKNYFDRSQNDHIKSFNNGLEENYSVGQIRRNLYNTNRFIFRRTKAKAIDYRSVQTVVLPQKGHLSVINYQESSISPNITIEGTEYNPDIGSKQNKEISFTEEGKNFTVVIEGIGVNRSFEAYSPRLLNFIEMEHQDEKWRSSTLH